MHTKFLFASLLGLCALFSNSQNKKLSREEVLQDLQVFKKALDDQSSYVYLNGYDFNADFDSYKKTLKDSVKLEDFGHFLSKTIGKIGDRHAYVKDFEPRDSIFLPFIYAPDGNKVVVLERNRDKKLETLSSAFPYLKKVDGIAIADFLKAAAPEEATAPGRAFFARSVRKIRDIQKIYGALNKPLPSKIELTLSDASFSKDTVFEIAVVPKSKRSIYWDEDFERKFALVKDEDYGKPEIVSQLFSVNDGIAYIQLPAMVAKEDAPALFEKLNSFMDAIRKDSKALIIDVRSNGGGTRDLTYELAKYLVQPDAVYVVNCVKQRAPLPLPKDYKQSLHDRNLYAFSELDKREQQAVSNFLKTFKPMYNLDGKKYSEYYFGMFNGKKLAKPSSFYRKPVYILANEESFSAASVFVSVFKGLPNVKVVGVTTDGSSGNSERFELPNSKIRMKISTMVSFQKDGKILDGQGTTPDIAIERDMDQILWKSDTQLEKLKALILKNN